MPPDRLSRAAVLRFSLALALAAAAPLFAGPVSAQTSPSGEGDPWYRIEIMVFRQPGSSGFAAEAWAPEPTLSYPSRYRYLIDRDLADARQQRFPGSRSHIDALGMQNLLLVEPRSRSVPELEMLADPLPLGEDIPTAPVATDADAPEVETADAGTLAVDTPAVDAPVALDDPDLLPQGPLPIDPPRADAQLDLDDPELPLPPPPAFTLLPDGLKELNRDAARMRSAGYDVLVHAAWVQPVAAESDSRAIILDRSGDLDSTAWPVLQGSVSIHLSRYLHISTRLWLNTQGDYLHPDWRMPPPPRAPASVQLTLPGLDDWYARRVEHLGDLDVARPDGRVAPPPLVRGDTADDAAPAMVDEQGPVDSGYPWRHAILLEQSRRMRGGELHYIDHPVLGVLVKMTLLEGGDWRKTYRETRDWQWNDRHNVVITGQGGINAPRENRP